MLNKDYAKCSCDVNTFGSLPIFGRFKTKTALYGIGHDTLKSKQLLEERGIRPVCVIDQDSGSSEYLGLPVLRLEQARAKYKNLDIQVTARRETEHDNKYDVIRLLLDSGFGKYRILNYEDVEEYKGCHWLDSCLVVNEDLLRPCCFTKQGIYPLPEINWKGGGKSCEETILQYLEARDRLSCSIKDNVDCECTDCHYIQNRVHPINKKISVIHFGFNFPCQLSCVYCGARNAANEIIDDEKDLLIQKFDWHGFMSTLENMELLSEDVRMVFASGEITINPRLDEILDVTQKYPLTLASNAVKYVERISFLTARPGSSQNVSVDSGTRKTYKRIKRVDAYDKVWENIKKHLEHGANMIIKYIFVEENCNEIDVEGFIRKCEKTGVKNIHISADARRQGSCSAEQTRLMALMIHMAEQNGIYWEITNMVSEEERAAILQAKQIFKEGG